MNPAPDDTIAAISTPLSGEGGIGIVRLSGKNSIKIADGVFRSKKGKPSRFKSHTVHYGWILDVDEVLLTVMRAPATYTREDIVEISGHGGPVVLKKILDLCLSYGARLAEPGEFTKRAFLNGRIDLVKAEAVCDIISAKTAQAAGLAAAHIRGVLSAKLAAVRRRLIHLTADVEACLDYSEEGFDFAPRGRLLAALRRIADELSEILEAGERNDIFRSGLLAAIVGKPNVGKSSLLNALLLEERAIVSPIPGTTRDVVSETMNIGGIAVTFMDTAGMKRSTGGKIIETLALKQARGALDKAGLALFVVDASCTPDARDMKIASVVAGRSKKTILVLNKTDKTAAKKPLRCLKKIEEAIGLNLFCEVRCSALKKKGIEDVRAAVFRAATAGRGAGVSQDIGESPYYVNSRQQAVLKSVITHIRFAIKTAGENEGPELLAVNLKDALDSLGLMAGEITTEDVLDSIFSRFCVGK